MDSQETRQDSYSEEQQVFLGAKEQEFSSGFHPGHELEVPPFLQVSFNTERR